LKNTEEKSSFATIVSVLCVFGFGFVVIHCWVVRDLVALATAVTVAIGGLAGYWWGLWRTLASSVGCFAGFELANPIADRLIPFINNQWNQTIDPSTGYIVSGMVAGVAVTFLLVLVGILLRRNEIFRKCDQRAGLVFGLASTTASIAIVFWVLLASEPSIERSLQVMQIKSVQSDSSTTQSLAVERLSNVLKAMKKSYVMVALKPWNPVFEVAYFRDVKAKIESSLTVAWNTP